MPPAGGAGAPVRPAAAGFSAEMSEFLLPYEAARTAENPRAAVLEFLQSTCEAAAALAHWDRQGPELP